MTARRLRLLRRVSQTGIFLLFFWLILKTTFEVDFAPGVSGEITLPWPVSWFLELDPLAAVATLLASRTLYEGLLWSLLILIPTIFLGRFFCGWVCPMGTLNHWVSEIPGARGRRTGAARAATNRYRPWQRAKYLVLAFVLGTAFLGSLQAGLLDPLCLLARSLGTVVLPTLHAAASGVLGWVEGLGWPPLGRAAQGLFEAMSLVLLPFRQAHFQGIVGLGLVFLAVLALNRLFTRFWCRGVCPLGALLGLFSRFSLVRLEKDPSTCTGCGQCLVSCQGADDPIPGASWRKAECHLCLNCEASCPEGSLRFRLGPGRVLPAPAGPVPEAVPGVDVGRRTALAALGGGIAAVPMLRTGTALRVDASPLRIRPPGALPEEEFLARCIRCGQCMRVCPNNALHPAALEGGLEGLWTPVLIPRIGYCEPTCTLCGQVCPTGALARLTLPEKVGAEELPPVRIGTAFVDHGRCLPWAMGRPCIVCEEWCPTSPKAVHLEEALTTDREGRPVAVRRPRVDPALCTGCGACEHACPVQDQRAIRVTAVGESRSGDNQLLVGRQDRGA
ncbi:MAG: 4Fe-4S binding protein [Deltaproteobacteria bacterium]|nr:4Fe-4S binding protein [Deltaproteobacteria bacterium]